MYLNALELEYIHQLSQLDKNTPLLVKNVNTRKGSMRKITELLGELNFPKNSQRYPQIGRVFYLSTIECVLKTMNKKVRSYKFAINNKIAEMEARVWLKIQNEVEHYARERGLSLFMSSLAPKLINDYDWLRWEDERTKGYQVVFGLCEFLGFDPLFFQALDKEIFGNAQYRRRHYRDSPIRKVSSNARDVIITDNKKHTFCEQYNEGFMVAVMNAIKNIMFNIKDSGDNLTEITPSDLSAALEEYIKLFHDQNKGRNGRVNSFIAKGLNQPGNSGYQDERLTYKQLVGEVWSRWNGVNPTQGILDEWYGDGTSLKITRSLRNQLEEFNKRRSRYLQDDKYKEFLEIKYEMSDDLNMNNRFIKGASGMDSLLLDPETPASHKELYTDTVAR